jgi:hypothetical protein
MTQSRDHRTLMANMEAVETTPSRQMGSFSLFLLSLSLISCDEAAACMCWINLHVLAKEEDRTWSGETTNNGS